MVNYSDVHTFTYFELASSPIVPVHEKLTTPENTISYHNALSLSPKNFA